MEEQPQPLEKETAEINGSKTLSEAAKGAERAAKAESHPLSLYSEDGGGRQTDLSD